MTVKEKYQELINRIYELEKEVNEATKKADVDHMYEPAWEAFAKILGTVDFLEKN